MRIISLVEAVLLAALFAIAFMLSLEAEESIYYSQLPLPQEAGSPAVQTPVPLIEENARWGKATLSLFIDEDTSRNVPGFRNVFADKFREAAGIMSNALDNSIVFRFVSQPHDADIIVEWVRNLRAESLDVIGHTELNFTVVPSFSVINKAKIELLAKKEGKELTEEQTLALSLHELGHALGLGHSGSRESAMYHEAQGVTALSPVDVQSILAAYALEPLPDLYVSEAEFSKRVISRVIFRQYLYDGRTAIINDGLSESGPFLFSIEAGKSIFEQNAQSLKPGEKIILVLANISAETDFTKITIDIDRENAVRELNENNLYAVEVG